MSKKKEAIEGIKRLSGELKNIKTTLVKSSSDVKHMAKRAKVDGELRNLVRMRKMSPAEYRLAKLDEMAGLDDKAFGMIVESYKNRQSIVESGQIGTTDALEAGSMAKEIGEKRLKAETKKELKRLGAKIKMSEDEEAASSKKRLEAEKEIEGDKQDKHLSEGFAGSYSKEMSDKYCDHMKHLEHCLEKADHEGAKEHLKHMKKMAEEHGAHPVGMKHLAFGNDVASASELQAAKIAELEEHVGQVTSVVDRLAAGVDKLMAAEAEEGHEELRGEPGKAKEAEKELEAEHEVEGKEKELSAEGEDKEKDEKHLEEDGKDKSEEEKHLESEARKDMGLADKKDEEGKKDLEAGKEGEKPEDKKKEEEKK